MNTRSLAVKLGAVYLVLLLAVGAVSLWLLGRTANLYFLELQQRLNCEVAEHLAEATRFFQGDQIDQEGLRALFAKVKTVHPTLEVYVLDQDGRIVAHDAPPEEIVRERVDMSPLHAFIAAPESVLPIAGDDPRDRDRRKVFSAAPVRVGGELKAYVYAIVASEQYDSVAKLTQRGFIVRGGAWIALACLLLAAMLGLLALGMLTRPLRRLQKAVNAFRHGNMTARAGAISRDEIGTLARDFDAMADRIVEQMSRIRETDRQRRELVVNISHDLRTPLAAVQGFLETSLMKAKDLPRAEPRQYLEGALRNTRRMGHLVDDLFQMARLDAGEIQLELESFALGDLVQDALEKFQLLAGSRGVGLSARIPEELPPVTADIALIERALDNLVDNAVRYTPSGGKVVVALSARPGAVEVRVIDTGPGIPPEDLPHVFERFYRVEKSRNLDEGGAGLGLAIAKRIVELHHGRIFVRSKPGVGTVFHFELAA